MVYRKTKPETIAESAVQLKAWLDENGPATKHQISAGLIWSLKKLSEILGSQPEWLVSPGVHKPIGNPNARETLYHSEGVHKLGICSKCGSKNFHPSYRNKAVCFPCDIGKPAKRRQRDEFYTDEELAHIDPQKPCESHPGSKQKEMTLAKRYALGLPLWDDADAGFESADTKWVGPPDELEDDWD